MKRETVLVWDAICRRAVGMSADECGPEMVSAELVTEPLFEVLREFGPRETSSPIRLDEDGEALLKAWFSSSVSAGAFPLKMLKPKARDEARELVQLVFMSIMLVSEAGLDYGPLPAGLRGRHLALAALALEILETRSPQRLLAERLRQAH